MGKWRRHAIYFAPDQQEELAVFGSAWLRCLPEWGRLPAGMRQPVPGLPREREALVAGAARYGFHATLKPPFRLAPGMDVEGLDLAAGAIAALCPRFSMRLQVAVVGSFVGLTPAETPPPPLAALERALVIGLDPFRAPLRPDEVVRRRPETLSDGERENLLRWGYPWVLDRFFFHMTLTGPLRPEERGPVRETLATAMAPLLKVPVTVAHVCRFGEDQDGRFHELARYPLG